MTQLSSMSTDQDIQDVGPLVWILKEVDHSLESARQLLRKFLHEQTERSRDGGVADTSSLRTARSHIHQATGAVEVVELAGAPGFLKALEAAVAHCVEHPEALNSEALNTIERGMNALHEYLQSASTGKRLIPLKLFANYASIVKLSGTERIHPADLWHHDFEWRDISPNRDSAATHLPEKDYTISSFDRAILYLLRGKGPDAANQLTPIVEAAYDHAQSSNTKSFWAIAASVVEALSKHAIKIDDHVKRAFTRMSLQIRSQMSGKSEVSERLARDLLFFASQAAPIAAERSVWLGPVQRAYDLTHEDRIDYSEQHYAAVDPAILQLAQRRVTTLKQLWSELSNGDVTRIRSVIETSDLVSESLAQLSPDAAGLGTDLSKLVKRASLRSEEMTADRALEVANAILFLEAALQSGEINGSQFVSRQSILSARLQKSLEGHPAGPMDPWMEELYRKSSEAQTMGSVVQELKTSMSAVESALDRYFRNASDRESLAQVPGQLSQAKGVLSVLGLDHAAAAVAHARTICENWILNQGAAPHAESQLIAQNLGALSFMVDLLGYQPAAAKSMFVFDAESHEFKSGLREVSKPRKTERRDDHSSQMNAKLDQVVQQLALPEAVPHPATTDAIASKLEAVKLEATISDSPEIRAAASTALDALRAGDVQQAAELLTQHIADEKPIAEDSANSSAPSIVSTLTPTLTSDHGADDYDGDDELLGIFLDEAAEVIDTGESQVTTLRSMPGDNESLVTLRRSFHTLKGSSRMVGLTEFGEAAWQMEQVLNSYLADPKPASSALLDLSHNALDHFKHWASLIKSQSKQALLASHAWPAAFTASAETFKTDSSFSPILLSNGYENSVQAEITEITDFEILDSSTPLLQQEASSTSSTVTVRVAESQSVIEEISLDLSEPVEQSIEKPDQITSAAPSIQADEMSLDEFFAAAGIDAVSASSFTQDKPQPNSQQTQPVPLVSDTSSAQVLLHPNALPIATANDEEFKQIGDLRIPIGLHNVYLSEADELVRKLTTELDMWRIEQPASDAHASVPEGAISAAHTLAGTSATVGVSAIADVGYELEAALLACQSQQHSPTKHDHAVMNAAAEEMRKLLHQFAAGFIKDADDSVRQQITALKDTWKQAPQPKPAPVSSVPLVEPLPVVVAQSTDISAPTEPIAAPSIAPVVETAVSAVTAATLVASATVSAAPESSATVALKPLTLPTHAPVASAATQAEDELTDAIDPDLFPIFEEEAQELLPSLTQSLRAWHAAPETTDAPKQSLRVLHTFKGSARLAGAMRLGEMAHLLESDVESTIREGANASTISTLVEQCDDIVARFEQLRAGEIHSAHEFEYQTAATASHTLTEHNTSPLTTVSTPSDASATTVAVTSQFKLTPNTAVVSTQVRTHQAVRVKAGLLDRLFNQAGEVSITRSRLENEIGSIKGSLGDLTDNLSRLREQLRAIELQAETQMQSRMAATKEASDFDPLEFDRFTRFQELTRMMAESVNDVATVQQALNKTLVTTEDDLQRQARMTRELQRDLLRTRMVEFESLSERLYRVVRQTAKELGKNVRLDIEGGQIEIDRGVLDRMAGSFEHLLRNCVAHGIELPQDRTRHSKAEVGQVTIGLKQESNEVSIVFSDDGAGLNYDLIRKKAEKLKLLDAQTRNNETALAELIFAPGFSTAESVSEISGRGIGMDVVKSEIQGLGGRVTVASQAGKGTTFTLVLPLTTAVTQIVLLRSGAMTIGVPSSLIEIVQRMKGSELAERYARHTHAYSGLNVDFFPLSRLLQLSDAEEASISSESRANPVVVVRSAAQRVAMHVDEILGNQEVVVRNLGPQLSRVPGLAGMSVLASGAVVLIYNPVALAAVYGPSLRAKKVSHDIAPASDEVLAAASDSNKSTASNEAETSTGHTPTVMVVDDSLTVRRVTQRLLQRHGYKVMLAKDGLDALEALQDASPDVMLLDIEMPRMDGFDLTRNMRSTTANDKLRKLPIIMITSRIADKHKTLAMELGVNHYLGKPYNEDELLRLIKQYTKVAAAATA